MTLDTVSYSIEKKKHEHAAAAAGYKNIENGIVSSRLFYTNLCCILIIIYMQ